MDKTFDVFKKIVTATLNTYEEEMQSYLSTLSDGKITENEVALLILNVNCEISRLIFFNLKDLFPPNAIDVNYCKVILINKLSDAFESIKDYNPHQDKQLLSREQLNEVMEKGSATINLPDGSTKIIHKEDIVVRRSEAKKSIKEEQKKEVKRIITPYH